MIKRLLLLCLFVGSSATAASAIDMSALLPCKPAAQRYCERTGSSMTDLIRCGATLAAISEKIGLRCKEVLRRYGQL